MQHCALPTKEVMREGIKTTNRIKNISKISKESIKEGMINKTKKGIEKFVCRCWDRFYLKLRVLFVLSTSIR